MVYRFSVRLDAPPDWAYRWATDYRSDDTEITGDPRARIVERLADHLVLLTDTFPSEPRDRKAGRRGVKARLVHLYPERRYWVSQHVSGPALHSQFLYEVVPRGSRSSTLLFTGSHVEEVSRTPTRASIAARAAELRRDDLAGWRRYARALREDRRRAQRRSKPPRGRVSTRRNARRRARARRN